MNCSGKDLNGCELMAPYVTAGFDDEKHDYILRQNEVWLDRWEIGKPLGKGSFGQVVHAFDRKYKAPVAIKIIKNRTSFQKQARIEIEILSFLNERDGQGKYKVGKYDQRIIGSYHTLKHEWT